MSPTATPTVTDLIARHFADLPGVTVEEVGDGLDGEFIMFRIRQRLVGPPDRQQLVSHAPVPVTVALMMGPVWVAWFVASATGPVFRPWSTPDRSPFPELVLFPRTAQAGRWLRRTVQR